MGTTKSKITQNSLIIIEEPKIIFKDFEITTKKWII